jgi:predicted phosphodiesterase
MEVEMSNTIEELEARKHEKEQELDQLYVLQRQGKCVKTKIKKAEQELFRISDDYLDACIEEDNDNSNISSGSKNGNSVKTDPLDIFKAVSTGEIKSISRDYKKTKQLLIPLGDVHLGSPTCNVGLFRRTLDFIEKTDCLVILMGDLMEAASKTSVGAGWVEQTSSPQHQLDVLAEVLSPIKDKILINLEGNHEERIWKQSGIRVSKVLSNMLGVPFGGYSAFVKLRIASINYIIHAQHGSSNAWYPHTKLTAAMRTAQHTDADLYLYGHTHELMSIKVPRRSIDKR